MAVPKRKHSKRRKSIRRSTIKLKLPHLIKCKNCGKATLSHHLCKYCKK